MLAILKHPGRGSLASSAFSLHPNDHKPIHCQVFSHLILVTAQGKHPNSCFRDGKLDARVSPWPRDTEANEWQSWDSDLGQGPTRTRSPTC